MKLKRKKKQKPPSIQDIRNAIVMTLAIGAETLMVDFNFTDEQNAAWIGSTTQAIIKRMEGADPETAAAIERLKRDGTKAGL